MEIFEYLYALYNTIDDTAVIRATTT